MPGLAARLINKSSATVLMQNKLLFNLHMSLTHSLRFHTIEKDQGANVFVPFLWNNYTMPIPRLLWPIYVY